MRYEFPIRTLNVSVGEDGDDEDVVEVEKTLIPIMVSVNAEEASATSNFQMTNGQKITLRKIFCNTYMIEEV